MKRRLICTIVLLAMLIFSVLAFSACVSEDYSSVCHHIWVEATCTTPKSCSICHITHGTALGHAFIPANCTTPKTCSACSVTEGEALGHTWNLATCTSAKTCTVCAATDGNSVGHTFTNGKCDYCELCDEEYCWPIYQDILNEMLTLDERMNSITFIEDNIQKLPLGYRQIDQIKEELVFVKTQFEVFSHAIYCDIMKYLCEEEEITEYYIDYSQVRGAYLKLLSNDEKYDKWNLTKGAENYMVVDNEYMFFVLVGNWESTSGDYYLDIVENDDNSISFRTNIPNDKDADYDYFYFIDSRNIGYSRTDNSELKFNAFKVTEITEDYIKVLCYKNSNIYTLYRK